MLFYVHDLFKLSGLMRRFVKLSASGEVPRQKTILRGRQLADALLQGYKNAFGQDPTAEVLGMGYSQAMHEQGGNFWNYNFGNITASPSWQKSGNLFVVHKNIREYSDTGERLPIYKNAFRAYATAADGATDYWKFLAKRYPGSVKWFAAGDPVNSAMKLSDERYYTGNRMVYAKNMSWFFDQFMTKIAPQMGLISAPTDAPEEDLDFKAHRKSKENQEIPEKMKAVQDKYRKKGTGAASSVGQLAGGLDAAQVEAFIKQLFS